jgi:hypothetical protein
MAVKKEKVYAEPRIARSVDGTGGGGAGGSGGGSMTVGNPVVGAGANQVLFADAAGNLKTVPQFAYVETTGALVVTPSALGTGILVQGTASPINGLSNLGVSSGLFEMGIAGGPGAFSPIANASDGVIRISSSTGNNGNFIFVNNNSGFVGDFIWTTGALGVDTEKMRLTQGGKLSISPAANARDNFRLNHTDGTARVQLGVLNATPTFAGIWLGNVVPSDLNYILSSETGANVLINAAAAGTIAFRFAAATNIYSFVAGIATFGAATAGVRVAVPFRTHAAIGANTNDYAPSAGNGVRNRISSSGAFNVTGLVAGSDGEMREFWNVGANNISITNQDAASAAANRFTTNTGATLVLAANGCIRCVYDTISTTWRVVLL